MQKTTKLLQIYVTPTLLRKLKAQCKRESRTMKDVVTRMIASGLAAGDDAGRAA